MADESKLERDFQALLVSSEQEYLTLRTQLLHSINQAQGTNNQAYFENILQQLETEYQQSRDFLLQKKREYDRVKAERRQALLNYEVAKAVRQAHTNLRERYQ